MALLDQWQEKALLLAAAAGITPTESKLFWVTT
jgi:hypothetical protein